MYSFLKRCQEYKNVGFIYNCIRCLSATEVATALRPFYFAVHPDLFCQYPDQRVVNENSLKQLNSFLESIQSNKHILPVTVQFYLRKHQTMRDTFSLINIPLRDKDPREAVLTILRACDLSTKFVDQIKPKEKTTQHNMKMNYSGSVTLGNEIFGMDIMAQRIHVEKEDFSFKNWLNVNVGIARLRTEEGRPVREEIDRLQTLLRHKLKLKDLRWECGWDISHFRGCLQALQALADHYPEQLLILRDRILVFAPFTGVSLDGHVMLNSGDVRYNWLDLINRVDTYDTVLLKIPAFEKAVSRILLDIKVGRRKFMPKIKVKEYEKHLRSIITSLMDYKSLKSYPKHWPASLKDFEIVVESEAGPLMVSPTGQFIVPSTCPGFLLVNFITNNLNEASDKLSQYKTDKNIEQQLHAQVIKDLSLRSLRKDDIVTPELMIQSCERILLHRNFMRTNFNELAILITTYYSVMSDGTVCIPWNWKLD